MSNNFIKNLDIFVALDLANLPEEQKVSYIADFFQIALERALSLAIQDEKLTEGKVNEWNSLNLQPVELQNRMIADFPELQNYIENEADLLKREMINAQVEDFETFVEGNNQSNRVYQVDRDYILRTLKDLKTALFEENDDIETLFNLYKKFRKDFNFN